MIKIIAEALTTQPIADTQTTKPKLLSGLETAKLLQRSSNLAEAIAALRKTQEHIEIKVVDQIADALETIQKLKAFQNNSADLCIAVDALTTSLRTLDGMDASFGVGKGKGPNGEEVIIIPEWKCKEWICFYNNSDRGSARVRDYLSRIYEGASALREALGGTKSKIISVRGIGSEIAKTIIGDKDSKSDRPFGARGMYETYVQYVTSTLSFGEGATPVFSIIPDPTTISDQRRDGIPDVKLPTQRGVEVKNGGGGSKFTLKFYLARPANADQGKIEPIPTDISSNAGQESELHEGTSRRISVDKGRGRRQALHSLVNDCNCTYLKNDETIVVFTGKAFSGTTMRVLIINDMESLMKWLTPTAGPWEKLRVAGESTASFPVECQINVEALNKGAR